MHASVRVLVRHTAKLQGLDAGVTLRLLVDVFEAVIALLQVLLV